MTPRELACAMRALGGGHTAPPDRAALLDLMTRFPDG
jgi:uncharacterized phage protein (TIGR02216 family)